MVIDDSSDMVIDDSSDKGIEICLGRPQRSAARVSSKLADESSDSHSNLLGDSAHRDLSFYKTSLSEEDSLSSDEKDTENKGPTRRKALKVANNSLNTCVSSAVL